MSEVPGGDEAAPQREDEQDNDLLTYSEVAVRLHEEIVALRARVAEIDAEGGEGAEAVRKRLTALEGAAERNSRQPINDENFERFFGYKGNARRNT
jgi:hypothetical protein